MPVADLSDDLNESNYVGCIIRRRILWVCTHLIDELLGALSVNDIEHFSHVHLMLSFLFHVVFHFLLEDDLLNTGDR